MDIYSLNSRPRDHDQNHWAALSLSACLTVGPSLISPGHSLTFPSAGTTCSDRNQPHLSSGMSHALPLLRTSFHSPPHPAPYLTGSDKLHLFQALTILVMVASDVCVAKSRGPFSVQLVHNFFTTCNTSDHACLRETFLFLLASMVPVLLLFHWPLLLNLLIHSFILSHVPSTNIY